MSLKSVNLYHTIAEDNDQAKRMLDGAKPNFVRLGIYHVPGPGYIASIDVVRKTEANECGFSSEICDIDFSGKGRFTLYPAARFNAKKLEKIKKAIEAIMQDCAEEWLKTERIEKISAMCKQAVSLI